jgi:hypothetical protein
MTKEDFIKQAVASGKPKEEIRKVFDSIDAAGEFDDSEKPVKQPGLIQRMAKGALDFVKSVPIGAASSLATVPGNMAVSDWQRGVYPGISAPQPDQTQNQQLVGQYIANMAPKTGMGKAGLIAGQILTPTSPLDIVGFGATVKGETNIIKAVKNVPKIIGRTAVTAMEEQSGMPAKVLKAAGTPEGLNALKQVQGKAYEIGQNLVKSVYNPWDAIPESKVIKEILPNLPSSGSTDIIASLRKHFIENPISELKPLNDKILNKMNEIQSMAMQNPDGKLSAVDLANLRQQIDKVIDDNFGQGVDSYLSALKDARHAIKESLLKSANESGNIEYASTMKTFANKLDLVDKLKGKLGENISQGQDKAQGFISNLFGKNRTNTQETLKNFDAAFGTNYFEQANAAHLADYLNPDGKLPLFTKWPTGRSGMLGKLGAVTIGSPRLDAWALNHPKTAATIGALGAGAIGLETIGNMSARK